MASKDVILKNVRLYWGDLWKPAVPGSQAKDKTPKYGATVILENGSDNHKAMTAAILEVARAEWGEHAMTVLQAMEASKKCLRKGDNYLTKEGAVRPEFVGKWYVVARNKQRPAVVAHRMLNGKFIDLDEAGRPTIDGMPPTVDLPFGVKAPYNGCYINLKLQVYSMKAKGEVPNSVNGSLMAVQFAGDGPAFGSAPGTAEGFGDMGGENFERADEMFGSAPAAPKAAPTVEDLFG